eukprot:GHVT01047656.1.p3 GENE.GHVT01047656.1~~GHVT01047656.1.p3  ORF type:complete len:125 (+),score=13.06 GHVT01047656.1:4833-5207(+)
MPIVGALRALVVWTDAVQGCATEETSGDDDWLTGAGRRAPFATTAEYDAKEFSSPQRNLLPVPSFLSASRVPRDLNSPPVETDTGTSKCYSVESYQDPLCVHCCPIEQTSKQASTRRAFVKPRH